MLTSPDLTNSLSDFSVYSAIAHLYTACAKIDFVHLCVFVYQLDVCVCGLSRHALPACLLFLSQTGVC